MSLTDLIRDAIVNAINDNSIERDNVTQLIVGPSPDLQTLCLWANESWEDYDEYSAGDALAEISNAAWLDRVDALSTAPADSEVREPTGYRSKRSELDLGDLQESYLATRRALRVDIQDALRELATGDALGEFSKVVGLMENGMSVSGYADLVAFYHPLGAGEIWPIHETRAGDIDIYQFGVLHDDGITMFYPEGQGDSLADDNKASGWKTYSFADMESWRSAGRRDDIYLRMRGDLHDIRFTNGHDHDEWGGPGREQINAALAEHFGHHPELTFNPNRMPHPNDSVLFERWVTTYNQQNCDSGRNVVRHAYDEFGETAVRQFIEHQSPNAEDRGYTLGALADRLFADHQFERALELIAQLDGKARLYEWREEMQSLLLLKRYQEAIDRGDVVATADDNKRAEDILAFRAIALAGLGRDPEAAELLEGVEEKKRDDEVHFAEAFLYRHSDPERARSALIHSLARSSRFADLGTLYLEDSPPLLAILDERAHIQQQRESHDARVAEIIERVSPEVVPLEIIDAATAGLSSGPGGEAEQWRVIAKIERDGDHKGSFKKLVRVAHSQGIAWVPTQTGGLTGFDLSDSGRPKLAYELPSETSLEDACRAGRWLFAADYKHGLAVVDLETQQIVAHSTRLFNDSLSAIAIGDGFVAVVGNQGAELYDIHEPTEPKLLSVVGSGYSSKVFSSAHGEDVAVSGNHLFMAAGHAGLVVADVTDRKDPQVVAALTRDDKEFWADTIDIYANIAVLTRSNEAWFVDITNPTKPQSLCVLGSDERKPQLKAFTDDATGDRLVGCDENLPVIWTIDLDGDGRPTRTVAHPTMNAEGNPDRFFYYRDAQLLPDGRLAVLTGSELMVLERQSAGEVGDVTAAMRAAEEPLRKWVLERLQQHADQHSDVPIGVLVLSLVFTNLEMGIEPARTIAGVDAGPIREDEDSEPELYEAQLGDITELPPENDDDDDSDPLGLLEKRKAGAWIETVDAVLHSLRDEPLLRDHAAGRLYLVRRAYDPRRDRADMRVIDVLTDDSKPWMPHRRGVVERGPKTLAEKLEDYSSVDKYKTIAREDYEIRAELFSLATAGNLAALRVIWSLRDLDEEAVLRTFLAAASTDGLSELVISGLSHFADRDEVRLRLEEIFTNPPEIESTSYFTPAPLQLKLAAAAALERTSDDEVLEVIRSLLDDPEGDYRHADLAIETIEAMHTRMHELLPSLRGWLERADANDNRMPGICKQLFRAGHWELPEKILAQSAREKRSEEYATVKLGIKGLEGELPQHEACAAERLFTSRMLIDRAIELRRSDDRDSSVWPAALPLEPWPGSWRFVLERALPILKIYGELDHFVELLCAHAVPEERYSADRALLLGVANYYENTNQHTEWRQIAEAILAAPDAFEGAPLKGMRKRNRRLRLQEGWELLKARDLIAARAIADQAMADEPEDGQVLFFDSRLVWLEADSPAACVERAKQHMERLGHDPEGRGRLLNVIGCALDEQGKVNDALPYFERAAQAHPEEPLYLANIAECYEKLGRMDQAVHWAREALERGVKSELCERITAATAR